VSRQHRPSPTRPSVRAQRNRALRINIAKCRSAADSMTGYCSHETSSTAEQPYRIARHRSRTLRLLLVRHRRARGNAEADRRSTFKQGRLNTIATAPAEFSSIVEADMARWQKLFRTAKIEPQQQ